MYNKLSKKINFRINCETLCVRIKIKNKKFK